MMILMVHFDDFKAFIEYPNDKDYIYKNVEECNPNKKSEISIAFDERIADKVSNKKLNLIVTVLYIRGRKLNIFFFVKQSYFSVQKNQTKFYALFYHENPKQTRTRQIAFNNSPDIDLKDFMNLCKKRIENP